MQNKQFGNKNFYVNLKFDKQRKFLSKTKMGKSNEMNMGMNDYTKLLKLCQEAHSVEQQILLIVNEIGATFQFYKKVPVILKELTNIIKKNWNEPFSIQLFGSAFTGLALKNSDADIFIDFKGSIPPEGLESIKNLLKKSKSFYRVIAIHAKVPIVQCIHKSKIMCEISFTTSMGFHNSKLIQFLFYSDERLKPLFLIINYLIKKNISSKAINSFCIATLLIYFLQQLQPHILPPIIHLQNLASSKCIIEKWNVAFATSLDTLSSVGNKMSVLELLKAFFKFYSEFDFGFYVVSSFMGKVYFKYIFDNADLLPNDFFCYKENLKNGIDCKFECNKLVCIQSPFDHGHNIAKRIDLNSLLLFQKFCSTVFKVFEESEAIECDPKMFFQKLFTNVPSISKSKLLMDKSCKIYPTKIIYLENNFISTENDIVIHWGEKVITNLVEFLKRVLKCNVHCFTKEDCPKQFQYSACKNTFRYILCDFHKIILIKNERKESKGLFDFPRDMCPIIKEEMISNYLLDMNSKFIGSSIDPVKFNINCSLFRGPTHINLDFICTEKIRRQKAVLQEVFSFLKKTCLPILQSLV